MEAYIARRGSGKCFVTGPRAFAWVQKLDNRSYQLRLSPRESLRRKTDSISGMRLFALLLASTLSLAHSSLAQRTPGNPLEHLPPNIEILTHFGERADISPDNQRVAFMTKSFGDAMVVDLKSRMIQCLTCNVPGAAFLRVMHLVTGDYILIGPDHFEDVHISRTRDNELWFLSKERGAKPVRLGQKMSEGAAISKKTLKIAFSQVAAQASDLAPEASRLIVADVDLSGVPRMVNQKTVYESKDRNCVIEAQDFYDNDTKMTFTCYEPEGHSSVMGIDLKTGQVTNFSKAPGTYNESKECFQMGLIRPSKPTVSANSLGARAAPETSISGSCDSTEQERILHD
jgi:hypothetical protein